MEYILLIREFEKEPLYELVEIIRFENGRRYIYKLSRDREHFIHVVTSRDVTYVELWHPNFAVPLLVFKVADWEELSRVLILFRSLVKVL